MKVAVKDGASGKLLDIAARVVDLTPLMNAMGRHMVTSVRSNFAQGGRPNEWEPLASGVVIKAEVWKGYSREMKAKMRKMGYNRVQGRARMGGPLVLTGDLKSSIGYTAEPRDLLLWARPKNDAVKAPVHQWGVPDTEHGGSGRLAGKNHNVAIPARPYLLFQPQDLSWFRSLCDGWIRIGRANA